MLWGEVLRVVQQRPLIRACREKGGGRYSERYIERHKEQHIECYGDWCYESYDHTH